MLTVNKTLVFRHKQKYWRAGSPKTVTSYRTIPLTDRYVHVTDDSLTNAVRQLESNRASA